MVATAERKSSKPGKRGAAVPGPGLALADLNGKQLLQLVEEFQRTHDDAMSPEDFQVCQSMAEEGEPITGEARDIAESIIGRCLAVDADLLQRLRGVADQIKGHEAKAARVVLAMQPPLHRNARSEAQRLVDVYADFSGTRTTANFSGTADAEPADPPKTPGDVVELKLTKLVRHPENFLRGDEHVQAIADSMAVEGQLEALVVRVIEWNIELPEKYQVLSGETRWLAAARLGWKTINCRVIECDDARARVLLATFNAKRKDLNPIQKARTIENLCKPKPKGSGLTRAAAGEIYGLSPSAASNLVRLLELPDVWIKRVESGELAESWARELIAAAKVPGVLKDLEQHWKVRDTGDWRYRFFDSRNELSEGIDELLAEHREPIKQDGAVQIPADVLEANRDKLGIVAASVNVFNGQKNEKREVEVATNLPLFNKLLGEARKVHEEKRAKGRATKAGKEAAEPRVKVEKTPAQAKHDAEQRQQQLTRNLDQWKHQRQRSAIAAAIRAADVKKANVKLLKLVWHFFVEGTGESFELRKALQPAKPAWNQEPAFLSINTKCAAASDGVQELQRIAVGFCERLVGASLDSKGGISQAAIHPKMLDALCVDWDVDLAAEWRRLWTAKDPAIEEFFQHHRKGEVMPLAKELGVHVEEAWSKEQMIKQLLGRPPVALPKTLQPEVKRAKSKKK